MRNRLRRDFVASASFTHFVERIMSSIPNNAMPHAVAQPEAESEEGVVASTSSFLLDGAQRLADKAREIPTSTLAIGAGVVAVTAAATVALTRRSGSAKRGSNKAGSTSKK